MSNSHAQPTPWHCNCRQPLGPYRLNGPGVARCLVCGVARHHDPTVARASPSRRAAPAQSAGDGGFFIQSWENEGGRYAVTDVGVRPASAG